MPRIVDDVFYDYIICGAGCAGLSLVMHLMASGKFSDRKILLVDKDIKNKNDRTWCFWEQEAGLFESIVFKSWQHLHVHTAEVSTHFSIAPYKYKLIRGIDFYEYCISAMKCQPNITFFQADVEEIVSNQQETYILIEGKKLKGQLIFNSILKCRPVLSKQHYWLLQHFRGWLVQTEEAVFDPEAATFMDFRTDQSLGTTFFYVLPFDERRALIEYTLFSKNLLSEADYDMALKAYIEEHLGIKKYTIGQTETGVIPMTNYPFVPHLHNIINMGTAGGQTKASSGFTFQFIQKHAKSIVESLVQTERPFSYRQQSCRFRFYDSILLYILEKQTLPGAEIFSTLFEKNRPASVLKFLDNETTVLEELRLISTLPTFPFLKAAFHHALAYL